jgi:hypothetical protein
MKTFTVTSLNAPLRAADGSYLRQTDMANLLAVTTRQVRRWERNADKEGRPYARPYDRSALAHILLQRRTLRWSREWAERLGLLDVFEELERSIKHQVDPTPADHRELACTNLLLHLAGEHLPEGIEFFKLGPGTVIDAQVMLGRLMSYAPTARHISKAWREAIAIYTMAMAKATEAEANNKAA